LRDHQKQALKIISKKDFGIIVAPPSSGKTIIGLKIIAEKQQPALIIVHRKQLVEQWIERIETFLGIPKREIGKIGQGKNKIGNRITVATIQSLPKQIENIETAFGTTGQYFGEGTDLQNINCLFLVYPFSFEGKLIQYIGRVQRSEISPIIYDYRDYRIDYLNKLFLKRNTYYRKINKQATLFDEPTEDKPVSSDIKTIEKTIKIQIEKLEFGYGVVSFNYLIGEMNTALEFEIENLEVRPEFDVLKPYFSKTLKSKNISVDIFAEFEYGKLVSQLANSLDIEKINQEVVESVKFQFITKNVLGKLATTKENLLTINELENQNLYIDGAILLEDILKTKNFKHSQNIRYLADKHQSNLMKIRFVLSPFSFVFLLSGEQQYHIVLETLDTEEATYLWHTDKSKHKLIDKVKEIDSQLNIIRNNGRQEFLETSPNNFSKIIHDYSDNKKGFIIWKDLLEERIT